MPSKSSETSLEMFSQLGFLELGFPSDDSQNDCVHLGLLLVESDSGFHAKETDQNNIKKIGEKRDRKRHVFGVLQMAWNYF